MQGILSAGFEIDAVEERSSIADVMHRPKIRRIEKAAASFGVRHQEVAPARATQAEGGLLADGAEGTVARNQAPRRLLAESGAGGCVDHQTGLVAILS